MNWIKVEDQLPEVDAAGESEFVLSYRGKRFIPEIVQYSNGMYADHGWFTTSWNKIPFYSGRGKSKHLTFTHWCKIELPDDK